LSFSVLTIQMQWQFWSTPRCNPSCFVHVFYGQSPQSSHSNIKYQPNLAAWFSIMMYYGYLFFIGGPGAPWGPLEWVKSEDPVLRRVKSASGRPQLETPWAITKKDRKVTPKCPNEVQIKSHQKVEAVQITRGYYKWLRRWQRSLGTADTPPGNCMELRNCTGHNSGPCTWALVLGVVWKWSDYPLDLW